MTYYRVKSELSVPTLAQTYLRLVGVISIKEEEYPADSRSSRITAIGGGGCGCGCGCSGFVILIVGGQSQISRSGFVTLIVAGQSQISRLARGCGCCPGNIVLQPHKKFPHPQDVLISFCFLGPVDRGKRLPSAKCLHPVLQIVALAFLHMISDGVVSTFFPFANNFFENSFSPKQSEDTLGNSTSFESLSESQFSVTRFRSTVAFWMHVQSMTSASVGRNTNIITLTGCEQVQQVHGRGADRFGRGFCSGLSTVCSSLHTLWYGDGFMKDRMQGANNFLSISEGLLRPKIIVDNPEEIIETKQPTTAAKEFNPVDKELNAALKTPATNKPGMPGKKRNVSITINGTN
uniref:Uncharacterized protein n=1 Tax=Glossina pallidipes TaxID=7398 RepID=A0A1B0AAC4_GLOPL